MVDFSTREQRVQKRAVENMRNRLHGFRKMTADELYDDLKELVDRHDLPIEIDGSADRIPVTFRHLGGWSLYLFPETVPVRIERQGELPDRSDELWAPLWKYLESLGTAPEAVKPLSAKGYRLFDTDPRLGKLEVTLRKMRG